MSAISPVRCLLSRRIVAAAKPAVAQCQASPFHSSAALSARRKSRFKNIRAEDMGLVTPEKIKEFTDAKFRPYSPEELEILRKQYTPEQMAALEAGEAAIDPKDLTIQGRLRRDPYRPVYLDDFSRILPVIDKRAKVHPPPNTNARFLNEEQHTTALHNFLESAIPQSIKSQERDPNTLSKITNEEAAQSLEEAGVNRHLLVEKFFDGNVSMNDDQPVNSSLAPEVGKDIEGIKGLFKVPIDPRDEGKDNEGIYKDLKRHTRLSVREITSIRRKVLVTRFVSQQTRLGKIQTIWVMAVAGNENGRLGLGVAKSVEPTTAIQKAKNLAVKNMRPIRRYEDRTIYGSVTGKVGGTIVQLDARPPGFGIRASHRLFEMFRHAGIHDIAAKMPRSRNPMNSVKACFNALVGQKDPDEIALGRGKKMVDVRKVYYGGNVL